MPARTKGSIVMKYLSASVFLIAGIACGLSPALAENGPSAGGHAVKKASAKKASASKKEAHADDEKEPDVAGLQATAFDCELGNKLTIYSRADDDQQIDLRWNKRLHHMTRIPTTTGAHRFENVQSGLVWIGIPAKGMLLDSKKGQQLANECRSPEQRAPKVAEKG
jgi:hypothetical protein